MEALLPRHSLGSIIISRQNVNIGRTTILAQLFGYIKRSFSKGIQISSVKMYCPEQKSSNLGVYIIVV